MTKRLGAGMTKKIFFTALFISGAQFASAPLLIRAEGADVISDAEVVTVRPEKATMTKQKLSNFVGVSEKTAGAKSLSMNMVIIPPGGKAEAHSHKDFESAVYLLKGKVKTLYG